MPNYNFKCLDCGHKFQKLLPVGHQEQACLDCGHPSQKVLEAPGVQFKGGGFYITDSKKSESKSAPESKVEKKTDTPSVTKD